MAGGDLIDHPTTHVFWTLVLLGVSVALTVVVRNRLIRRRLLFTIVLVLVAMAIHVAIVMGLVPPEVWKVEGVFLAFALINALVASATNPWFQDHPSDRVPAIVQDTVTVALAILAALLIAQNSELLTGSAIAAAVVGFALQETLGNAFAGLAIQVEKPFRVGHWITVGEYEGTVRQITWRATKIWTKAGNMVILPNSMVAGAAINNYSEPLTPTRLYIEVGVGYQVAPNDARDALMAALAHADCVLRNPAPNALLWDFAASALLFRVHFWVADYSTEETARDDVRRAIYYELRRRNIEIPWPIQIEYSRDEAPVDVAARTARFSALIDAVPVFAPLPDEASRALAATATELLFGDGEVIVREGDAGASLFIVCSGRVTARWR
jgi:small-conductance mechanosensitive channel